VTAGLDEEEAEAEGEDGGSPRDSQATAGARRTLTRAQSTVAQRVKRAHISEMIENPVNPRAMLRAGSTIGKRVHKQHQLLEEAEAHADTDGPT
jgi:hypothetical protein